MRFGAKAGKWRALSAALLAAAAAGQGAYAGEDPGLYPSRSIRLIVPYVAGGAADITARVIAQKLSASLGKAMVVENRPGANGGIGTDMVAKAPADGYTLLFDASGPLVVNPSLYRKTPYDTLKDFAPVSQVTSYQYFVEVRQDSPIQNLDGLIAAARARPGQMSYGSAGVGSGGHLAGELLGVMTDTELTHVPYKGNAQALTDLLGGQLSFSFDTVVTSAPHIKAGRLRAFAVTGPRRASVLPDIPTMEELGYKGFQITQFQGMLAPAGTDPRVIGRLHDEIVKAVHDPEVIRTLVTEGGNDVVAGTPDEFAELIRADLERYRKLITQARLQQE